MHMFVCVYRYIYIYVYIHNQNEGVPSGIFRSLGAMRIGVRLGGHVCLCVCLFVCSRVGRQPPALGDPPWATHPGRPTLGDPPGRPTRAIHPQRPTWADPPCTTHPPRSYRPLAGVRVNLFKAFWNLGLVGLFMMSLLCRGLCWASAASTKPFEVVPAIKCQSCSNP